MARVLCVSTYELGRQPQHLATLAAVLGEAGHSVRCADVALDALPLADVDWADCVIVAVPMHTAARLAAEVVGMVRERRGESVRVGVVGLYAELTARSLGPAVDWAVAGEFELEAARRVTGGDHREGPAVVLDRMRLPQPLRSGLPPLERYTRLITAGGERVAGYIEASRGCVHRCRHCPVPVVYDGRIRIRDVDTVVADACAQWDAGARHITLGDPDALNSPPHTLRVLRALHAARPEVTIDLTTKVEHIVRHPLVWPEMRDLGVVFLTTALETTDDAVLAILDKGHTREDARAAVRLLRTAGIEVRPSLLPFTPWTSLTSFLRLLDDLAAWDLAASVDAVQLGIRLLVPDGSLLLGVPEMTQHLTGTRDPGGHVWTHPDPRMDALQAAIAGFVALGADSGIDNASTHARVRRIVGDAATEGGLRWHQDPPAVESGLAAPAGPRPRLGEPWFCCAEPTTGQRTTLRVDAPTPGGARR